MSGELEASRLGASILACHEEREPANSTRCSRAEHSTKPASLCVSALPSLLPPGKRGRRQR